MGENVAYLHIFNEFRRLQEPINNTFIFKLELLLNAAGYTAKACLKPVWTDNIYSDTDPFALY